MSHELAEKIAGLASRVNNLAVNHTGDNSRKLMALQDRLAKLQIAAIVSDLRAERQDYKAALKGLNEAVKSIGEAKASIQKVSNVIKLVAKAATLADKAIKAVA